MRTRTNIPRTIYKIINDHTLYTRESLYGNKRACSLFQSIRIWFFFVRVYNTCRERCVPRVFCATRAPDRQWDCSSPVKGTNTGHAAFQNVLSLSQLCPRVSRMLFPFYFCLILMHVAVAFRKHIHGTADGTGAWKCTSLVVWMGFFFSIFICSCENLNCKGSFCVFGFFF